MSPLLPPHKSVCTPLFAMKSPHSRILYVVHHALGLRHFLALKLKHYKMGVQWYRSKSIPFHSNLKVFPTCGSLCHSFSLRSPCWPLELFLFWTAAFTDCLLHIPFGMTFPSLYWAEYPPNKDYWFHFFFFPSSFLEKAHLLQVCSHSFFFISDLPTDPRPHQVPHFFLFSDGDTLCLPSQLKIINTKVSISSQGLSSLTDRTLLNCTNSVESSLHSLLSPRSLFFPLSHLTSWQILLLFPLHYLGEICSWSALSTADKYLN